jgi:hypothetical protein
VPLNGKTNALAKEWLLAMAETFDLPGDKLAEPNVSQIPAHAVATGAAYDVASQAAAMAEFCNYYGNANLVLEAVRETYLDVRPGPNEIRMWPHHFDIAVLVTLEEGDPETAKAFGFGFQPGDSSAQSTK